MKLAGNFLIVTEIILNGDQDTLLIIAEPTTGPPYHTGPNTCSGKNDKNFLLELEKLIGRLQKILPRSSPAMQLFRYGLAKIAKKLPD